MPPRPIAAPRALWLIALVGTSCLAADPVERCDIGPSPDSPDFDSYNAQRSALHARLGYEPVCEDWIPTLPPRRMKPFEKVLGTLAFQPMRLGGTPFADYRLLGALPDIGGDKRGAAALRRYFSGANGELVELFEWDTSLGGGAYLLDPTRQTEKVNGHPAALTILQSKGGKAFSVLSWDRNRRHIELGVNRNVRAARHADFIRLAESLPAPSPAEPDAPMPEVDFPPPFGPGAPFPPHPPK